MSRLLLSRVALTLALGLTGCGDDGPTAAPSDPAPTTTSSEPAPTTSSPDPTGTTSAPGTEPAVATGPELSQPPLTMVLPDDFKVARRTINPTFAQGTDRFGGKNVGIGVFPDLSGGSTTLDKAVDLLLSNSYDTAFNHAHPPKRYPDVEIDGVTFAHIGGPLAPQLAFQDFITTYDGNTIKITYEVRSDLSRAEEDELVRATLATARID